MSGVLCTFPGKRGDILWSLATVAMIGKSIPVDMAIMPTYRNMLPLLEAQPYIRKAFVIEDWELIGNAYGDQPWMPQSAKASKGYDVVFHLGYRQHPTTALIDFIAKQQGLVLRDPLPFIFVDEKSKFSGNYIAYAFNDFCREQTGEFMRVLQNGIDGECVDVTGMDWVEAARTIRDAFCFVGCRSANYALAHGVGQKKIFVYETHRWRHAHKLGGFWCGCPYGEEKTHPYEMRPDNAAQLALRQVKFWWMEQSTLQESTR